MTNKFEIVVSAQDKVSKPLDNINKKFRDLAKNGKKAGDAINFKPFEKTLSSFSGAVEGLGVSSPLLGMVGGGFGAATVAAAMAKILNSAGRWGTSVTRLSGRTGIGLRQLQLLQGAARRSNVDPGLVDNSLRGLGGTLEDAMYGRNLQASMLLKALNVQVGKTATGAPDTAKAFVDIADAISRIANPETQNLVARQFGLEDLLPMLVKGKQGIKALEDQAEQAGEVMNDKGVKGLDNFSNSLARLSSNANKATKSVGNILAGPVGNEMDRISDFLEGKTAPKSLSDYLLSPLDLLGNAFDFGSDLGSSLRGNGLSDDSHGASGTWTDAKLPLGMRNNNPGNLRKPGGNGFQRFASMLDGQRAMASQLLRYYNRDGLDTINGIVNKWAPESDNNDTGSYIADMVLKTGKGARQHLDLNDPATLASLMRAMTMHEQGPAGASIDPKLIGQAVAEALRSAPLQVHVQGGAHASPQIGYAMSGTP